MAWTVPFIGGMDAADPKPIAGARTPSPVSVGEFVGLLRCAVFYATRGYGRRAWVLFGRPGTHAGGLRRAFHAARARRQRPWRRPPGAL
jgi:hypothetical protein